jgi:REP element-mobilizing transposase RayT
VVTLARKPRVHFPGATYHVISRGNNREWVFDTETEKRSYLALISHYKERYSFELLAWAIMSNHAHMLIKVSTVPLSKIMQGIQQSYTGQYNHAHERTGHVFEQRYKAFLCHNESQILETLHYIHYNPVRANMAGGLLYPFSSHTGYLSPSASGLTDSQVLLRLFASDSTEAVGRYMSFISKDSGEVSELVLKYARDSQNVEHSPSPPQSSIITVKISEMVDVVADLYGVRATEITGRSRRRDLAVPRRAIVLFCAQHTRIPLGEVARTLGVSPAAVSKASRFSDYTDNSLSSVLTKLKDRLSGGSDDSVGQRHVCGSQ